MESMNAANEVQRIRTEGRAIDPVRNVERLWIECEAVPVNGCNVEGHRVRGTARVEIYVDRLPRVLARVRTQAHEQAYAQACEINERLVDEWKREATNAKTLARMRSDADREAYTALRCNLRPEHQLPLVGYRTGLPPLKSCKVVHPTTGKTIDAREWQKLDAQKQREWMVDAPVTPQNAAQRANEHLAESIAKALAQMSKSK